MKLAALAILLAGCTCGDDDAPLAVPPPRTRAEDRLLRVRALVQKLANLRDLAGWKDPVDEVASDVGVSKAELRWRTADLVRLHRTCQGVATGRGDVCDGLAPLSVETADRCRSDVAYYGILCSRMIRRRACTGDDVDRVATLAHRDADFVSRACRAASGEAGACERDPNCEAWAQRASYIPSAKVPTSYVRDEGLFAALAHGHPLSCDRVLVLAIDARLRNFVIPPPPLLPKKR